MLRPLLKLADKLLLVGFLDDVDLESLLILLDPETFDSEYNPDGEFILKGLVQMQLEEGPKLQMCYLLHHLLEIQLRHRVEGLVAFCDNFVGELQSVRHNLIVFIDGLKRIFQDQLRRYISIKQEDLPTSVAAKKTKEFRCAPKDQVFENLLK